MSLSKRLKASGEQRQGNNQYIEPLIPPRPLYGVANAGVYVDADSALRISTVYSCVRLLGDTVSSLPMGAYVRRGRNRLSYTTVYGETPAWVNKPNPESTRLEFIEQVITSMHLHGNAFILTVRDDNNEAARRKKKAEQEEADNLKSLEEGRARRKEIEDFDTQLQQRLMELDEEKANKKRELDFQRIQNLVTDLDYEKELKENDFQDDLQRLANKEAYIAELKSIELSNLDLTEKERIDIIAKYAKQEQDIDKEITATKKAEAEARIEIQFAVTNAAGAAGRLLQSIAGENKKLAITGIILEQAAAIANIGINAKKNFVKDGGIKSPLAWLNLTAAGLAAASAVVSAKRGIAAINSSSLSDSSGISTGMPSMSTQAPMTPQLPMAQTTNLSQQTINDIGNQAVRAYVVESDITSSQERITAIRQRARFS